MRGINRRAKATLSFAMLSAVLSMNACVKIPSHNFGALPPVTAVAPPVQSSATVRFEGISSDPIGSALISALPHTIQAQHFPGGCANPCYRFDLHTFDAVLSNGKLVMSPSFRGNVQAKENFGECDLGPVNVDVVISARPIIKHNGAQWSLSLADVSVQPSIGRGSDTHCVILGLLDVTGTLQDNLNKIAGSIKSQVEALSFPVPVDDLAKKLLGPIALPSNSGRTFCVYPNITDLQIGTIEAWQPPFENAIAFLPNNNPIKTSLPRFLSIPLSFLGAPSVVATKASCPAPQPITGGIQLADGAAQLPFQLLAAAGADYDTLSDAASGTLKATTGHWGPLKLTVKPTRLQLGNSNGQIFAALSVTGSVSGTVYFWGTPIRSEDGKTVSIPNLTLAAESRKLLAAKNARLPDFIANLFSKPIQDAFTFNLQNVLPQTGGTQPISFTLGNNGILDLGTLNVAIQDVRSVEGQLQADVLIKGGVANAHNP